MIALTEALMKLSSATKALLFEMSRNETDFPFSGGVITAEIDA